MRGHIPEMSFQRGLMDDILRDPVTLTLKGEAPQKKGIRSFINLMTPRRPNERPFDACGV